MKYGDPKAITSLALLMANKIYNNLFANNLLSTQDQYIITTSAFGAVPTASYALMIEIKSILENRNIKLQTINIKRSGDFQPPTTAA